MTRRINYDNYNNNNNIYNGQNNNEIEGIYTFGGEGSNVQVMIESEEEEYSRDDLSYKVNSFLDNNELELLFAITNDILHSVFSKLSMNNSSLNSHKLKEYKEFLNKYGSIRHTAFDINVNLLKMKNWMIRFVNQI